MGQASDLSERITALKGVGEKTAALFEKCGIRTVDDLLRYYPRDYEIYDDVVPLAEAKTERIVSLRLTVIGELSWRRVRSLTIIQAKAGDPGGTLRVTWFNLPYLRSYLKSGHTYIFRGFLTKKGNTPVLQQPRVFQEADYVLLKGSMRPRYPLVKGLSNQTVSRAAEQAMQLTCCMEETLPGEILEKEGFLPLPEAVRTIHFPKDTAAFLKARDRLAFEEFYTFIRKLRALKEQGAVQSERYRMIEVAECERLAQALPYRLTKAQQRVWEEIRQDLSGGYVMNRLVQGDVGSGKTIVSFLALLMCAANGLQGAIMAPTSVLAAQHAENFRKLSERYELPVNCVLLTGSLSARDRKAAYAGIADGTFNLICGTHALIQEAVTYKNLALVVTDEQHRFGVRQREALAGKGEDVHVLAMSATPIPRSLAMILYGDVEVSLLDEVPAQRLPVKNALIGAEDRMKAWKMMVAEIQKGRQAYAICPMIEPGEMEGVQNVTEYAALLSETLPESIRIGVLHGKLKTKEKDELMERFAAGQIDLLVSTTVVEVGVDVPNATVMLIEDAQRFGLAQLHQLRGRVGRGDAQSYCMFLNTGEDAENERLQVMKETNDGFAIAEEDLKLRGPGELFGLRQSGALSFRIADIYRDAELLTKAAAYARG